MVRLFDDDVVGFFGCGSFIIKSYVDIFMVDFEMIFLEKMVLVKF